MGFFTHRPFGRAAALTLAAAMLLGTPSALAAQVPVELLGQENSISAPGVALVRSGKCGEAVNWGLGADNVLYIYGSGPMNDFSTNEGSRAPWAEELLARFARRAEHHSGGTGLRGCDQAGRICIQ